MTFSLVLGTLGHRLDLLEQFLESLAAQGYENVQLLVVDQSGNDSLLPILARYAERLAITHLRTEPGLSRARNVGLARATGEIVAFPDDDCRYPAGLLGRVAAWFEAHPEASGLAGRPVDAEGRSAFPRWDLRPGPVDRFNVWRRSNSNALFLRRAAMSRVGGFDESLGVGAGTPFGAAEDVDYPLRLLAAGFGVWYDPTLEVFHPPAVADYRAAGASRARSYGGGMGRVLRKHRYPWWFVAYQCIRPAGGLLLALATGRPTKARYHREVLGGRWSGWRAADSRQP